MSYKGKDVETLNLETVRKDVKELIKKHPKKKNPYDNKNGICLYQKGKRHCIVGQILANHNLPMPQENLGIFELIQEAHYAKNWEKYPYVDHEAARYLEVVQQWADGLNGDHPIPWGKIDLDEVEKQFEKNRKNDYIDY